MKNAMGTINVVLSAISFAAVIINLVMAHFGYAWLWLIPRFYGILNVIAIDKEK